VLGMVYDMLGNGPVGAMGFLLVLAVFCASRAFSTFDNNTLFMPIAVMCTAFFAIEIAYAVLMVSFGVTPSIVDALVYRALPCAVYDCLAGLLFFFIMVRVLPAAADGAPGLAASDSMQVSMTSGKDLGKVRTRTRRR